MPRRSAEHAAEMRQRIVRGAEQAIVAAGYRGASVDDIATAAGVSVGLLYRYFGSKEQLFLAVCHGLTAEALRALSAELVGIPALRPRLAAAVEAFVASVADATQGKLVANAWLEADQSEAVHAIVAQRHEQLRAFSDAFLRDAVARGEVGLGLDVDRLARATATLLEGIVARRTSMGADFDPGEAAADTIALLEAALAPGERLRGG